MHIKHIVLSGGGTLGICELSVLNTLIKKEVINMNNIQSIYGISIGSFIAILMTMGIDTEVILNYVINRPWDKLFKSYCTTDCILSLDKNKGIYGRDFFIDILSPLLKYSSYDETVTFQELYERSNIELYIYAARVDGIVCTEFSKFSHPNMNVITALIMSCAIPGIFQPVFFEDHFYIDAGIVVNYPIYYCLQRNGDHKDEILGIRFNSMKCDNENVFKEDMHIIPYMVMMLREIHSKLRESHSEEGIDQEVVIPYTKTDAFSEKILFHRSERQRFAELGDKYATIFAWYINEE